MLRRIFIFLCCLFLVSGASVCIAATNTQATDNQYQSATWQELLKNNLGVQIPLKLPEDTSKSKGGKEIKADNPDALDPWQRLEKDLDAVAPAKQRVRIIRTDGGQVAGTLVKLDKDEVVILVSGIQMTLKRSDVHTIQRLPSLEQIYKKRRAKLKDNDLQGRYSLAYFLYSHGANKLAIKELSSLAETFPKNSMVQALKQVIISSGKQPQESGIKPADHKKSNVDKTKDKTAVSPKLRADVHSPVALDKRLTQEQINRIKVYEIDLATHPRVRIPYKTILDFFRKYKSGVKGGNTYESRQAFRRMTGDEQLSELFKYRARDLYGQVQVAGDPKSLKMFHRRIQSSYVTNYCGTTKCHGGFKAPGGLYLFRAYPSSEKTAYTNFYILNHYKNSSGKMINRREPRLSLLIQYGLPRHLAKTPHPDVSGWYPVLLSKKAPRYQVYLQFIQGLYKPAPDYGIDYKIPVPVKKTTQKADSPKQVQSEKDKSEPVATKPAKTDSKSNQDKH